jgi:hypothetical protein
MEHHHLQPVNLAQIGGIIRWTPVKNLTFSADVTSPCLTRSLLD